MARRLLWLSAFFLIVGFAFVAAMEWSYGPHSIEKKVAVVPIFYNGKPTDYATNTQAVYYDGVEVSGADPNSFEIVPSDTNACGGPFYFADRLHVYAYGDAIPGADPTTFQVIGFVPQPASCGDLFAADATHVYFYDELVTGADPKTFRIFSAFRACGENACEAEDANHYYDQT